MEVVEHYYYTKEHEWINVEEDIGTIGITEYAQEALGDITFIELPAADDEVDVIGRGGGGDCHLYPVLPE